MPAVETTRVDRAETKGYICGRGPKGGDIEERTR